MESSSKIISRRWIFLLVIQLLGSQVIKAQNSVSIPIEYHGLKTLPASERISKIVVPQPMNDDTLRSRLRPLFSWYYFNCYFDARIDSIRMRGDSASSNVFHVWFFEGEQSRVDSLSIVGMRTFSEREALKIFEMQQGDLFQPSKFEEGILRLIDEYEEHGYPFVSIKVSNVERIKDTLQHSFKTFVVLSVDEGPKVIIETIDIVGATITKPDVILRETGLNVGDVYRKSVLEKTRRRLQKTGYFKNVEEPELFMTDRGGGVRLRVTEARENTFDGVVGYMPANSAGGSGYFVGLANVLFQNIFGTGRKLSARWEKENTQTQELELHYFEPWAFNLPFNLGFGFFQRQQDSLYVQRSLNMRFDFPMFENLTLSALGLANYVIPSAEYGAAVLPQSRDLSVGGEIQYDTRDEPRSPTQGYLYQTDVYAGQKILVQPSAADQQHYSIYRYGLDFDWFFSILSHQVILVRIHGRDVRSDALSEPDLFRIGGSKTLRGYREDQFLASQVAWGGFEYRFLTGKWSFMSAFVDVGYINQPADVKLQISELRTFKSGYGIGLQFDTSLGLLGVSYALGQGDTFTNGKIHFGLINDF